MTSKRQKALVLGATGYVGREVVRRLCEEGVETLAHVRPGAARLAEWKSRFGEFGATVVTVPWNSEAMTELFMQNSPSLVFSLIGTTKSRAKQEEIRGDIYQAVDYGLTKIVLDVCLAAEPPPRFIYLSSVGASLTSRSAYLRVRGQVEDELRSSSLSWVSAQPSMVTGHDRDEDRPAERWAAALADGVLSIASHVGGRKLRERYRSTSATQLGEALVELGLSEATGVQAGEALRPKSP